MWAALRERTAIARASWRKRVHSSAWAEARADNRPLPTTGRRGFAEREVGLDTDEENCIEVSKKHLQSGMLLGNQLLRYAQGSNSEIGDSKLLALGSLPKNLPKRESCKSKTRGRNLASRKLANWANKVMRERRAENTNKK
jgi:hypothetical protein